MKGYLMWIVLGALILIVIGFLAFSSVWDRKKRKKALSLEAKIKKEAHINISKVAIWVTTVISEVTKQLKIFVPSIGRHKMFGINKIAKDELIKIKSSKEFKTIIIDKDLHKIFVSNIDVLIKSKANSWIKKEKKIINFWKTQISTSVSSAQMEKEHDKFKQEIKKLVSELYE